MTKKNKDKIIELAIIDANKLLAEFNLFYMKYGIFPHEIWDKILNKDDNLSTPKPKGDE